MYYNENAFHEIKKVNKTQCKKIKHFKDLRKTRICVHTNTNSQCCKYDTPLATFLSIASSLYSSNKHIVSKYSHRYVVSVSCHQSPQQGTACTPSRAVTHTSTAKKKNSWYAKFLRRVLKIIPLSFRVYTRQTWTVHWRETIACDE